MSNPYSTENLKERAAESFRTHKSWIDGLNELFKERQAYRRKIGCPVLAVLGKGRAGKDTASSYLCTKTGMSYVGSSSNFLLKFVTDLTGLPPMTAWHERHQNREFWISTGHAVRANDLSLFARMTLAEGDLAVGLRGREEIYGCLSVGIVDGLMWIDRNVPDDPTMEVTSADCNLVIPNWGSYVDLYRRLDWVLDLVKWPQFGNFRPSFKPAL